MMPLSHSVARHSYNSKTRCKCTSSLVSDIIPPMTQHSQSGIPPPPQQTLVAACTESMSLRPFCGRYSIGRSITDYSTVTTRVKARYQPTSRYREASHAAMHKAIIRAMRTISRKISPTMQATESSVACMMRASSFLRISELMV
jgi:hypothetical protein